MRIKLVLKSDRRKRLTPHRPPLDQAEIDRYAPLPGERDREEQTQTIEGRSAAGLGKRKAEDGGESAQDVNALRATAAACAKDLRRLHILLANAERDVQMAPSKQGFVRRRDRLLEEVRSAERRAQDARQEAERAVSGRSIETQQWEEIMKRIDERDAGVPSQASTSALANDDIDPFQAELDQLIARVKAWPNGEVVYEQDAQEADEADHDDDDDAIDDVVCLEDVDSSDSPP